MAMHMLMNVLMFSMLMTFMSSTPLLEVRGEGEQNYSTLVVGMFL